MSAAPQDKIDSLQAAATAAGRLAEQTQAAESDIAGRPDRQQWAEGERRLARVRLAANKLAEQASSQTASPNP